MSLPLWLLVISIVVVAAVAGVVFVLWRRSQNALVCPRCAIDFDPKYWKKRNVREHYHGRYTIVPVYVCPICGYTFARSIDEVLK